VIKNSLYNFLFEYSIDLPVTTTVPSINQEKLEQFMGKVLSDFGGAASAVLTYIGDRLGLYKAMYDFGKPITSQELANNTRTSERYIRDGLQTRLPVDTSHMILHLIGIHYPLNMQKHWLMKLVLLILLEVFRF